MSKLEEKTIDSERIFNGRFLRVQRDRVICPDGKEREREYIVHSGAALAVPVLDDGRLVLIRQYRHALKSVFLEFPAGKRDRGEDSAVTVKRELEEETGYRAANLRFLGKIHPCIGYSDEFIDLYLATGLTAGEARPDPGEELEPLLITFEDLESRVMRGEVTDVKTLCAFFYYARERLSAPRPAAVRRARSTSS